MKIILVFQLAQKKRKKIVKVSVQVVSAIDPMYDDDDDDNDDDDDDDDNHDDDDNDSQNISETHISKSNDCQR